MSTKKIGKPFLNNQYNKVILFFVLFLFSCTNIYSQEKMALAGHTSLITDIMFSSDGKLILSTSKSERVVKVWELKTGDLLLSVSEVGSGCFLPDSKTILVAALTRDIDFWDIAQHRRISKKSIFLGENGANFLTISPNGKIIACATAVDTVRIFDLEKEKEIQVLKGQKHSLHSYTRAMCFSPNGEFLVTGGRNGQLVIWETKNWKKHFIFSGPLGHSTDVMALAFSPDGKMLVSSGNENHNVLFWDMATGNLKSNLFRDLEITQFKDSPHLAGKFKSPYHFGRIKSLAFSPDGRTLALAGNGKGLPLYDLKEKKIKIILSSNPKINEQFFCVAFSPDGKYLVTGSMAPIGRRFVKIWEVPK